MRSSGSMHAQIGTLIIATSGVQLANGFFGTFISLRVVLEHFDTTMAGLVLSSYFAGFTVGAVRCGRIIERIGHIRAYAAFAGLVVAATAAMPLLVGPLPWLVLRAVVGFGCAGLFVATESWLNAKALPSERGRIFSVYMVGTFIALALGQLLIGRARIETAAPFNAIVALFAVALVMVSTTRAEPPQATAAATAALRPAFPRGARRGRRLRAERAHRQRFLRARSGMDAGQGHRTPDNRTVHARGRAWRPGIPGAGWPALGPLRPAHRAGRTRRRLRRRRSRLGPPAAHAAGYPAGRSPARRLHVDPLPCLCCPRASTACRPIRSSP